MSNELTTPPEARVVGLVSGIITDIQVLIRQQLALSRYEFKGEIGHARKAGYLVALGLGIGVIGSVLLCAMMVHLLELVVPRLPLWSCYGIVGAPIAALGITLCLVGIQRFGSFNTATVKLALDLKENVDG